MLLSHIKGLIIVLEFEFLYCKNKASELSFYSRLKTYTLIVLMLAFVYKIIRLFTFSAVKKVSFPQSRKIYTVKEIFHCQETFWQSRNFSLVKEIFLIKEIFPQSRNFSTVKEFFHSQVNFSTFKELFPQSRNFSTVVELFHA